MKAWQYFAILLGLAASNALWHLLGASSTTWVEIAERTYWQGSALFIAWVVQISAPKNKE